MYTPQKCVWDSQKEAQSYRCAVQFWLQLWNEYEYGMPFGWTTRNTGSYRQK